MSRPHRPQNRNVHFVAQISSRSAGATRRGTATRALALIPLSSSISNPCHGYACPRRRKSTHPRGVASFVLSLVQLPPTSCRWSSHENFARLPVAISRRPSTLIVLVFVRLLVRVCNPLVGVYPGDPYSFSKVSVPLCHRDSQVGLVPDKAVTYPTTRLSSLSTHNAAARGKRWGVVLLWTRCAPKVRSVVSAMASCRYPVSDGVFTTRPESFGGVRGKPHIATSLRQRDGHLAEPKPSESLVDLSFRPIFDGVFVSEPPRSPQAFAPRIDHVEAIFGGIPNPHGLP